MSLDNFTPEVWSRLILRGLETSLVYGQPAVINRDYEGDINEFGDTVRINMIGDPTIGTYTKDTNITDPETLTSAQSVLTIDQSKYFNFAVDSIDRVQNKPSVMEEATNRAGYGLRSVVDKYIAALHSSIDVTGNTAGTNGGGWLGTSATPQPVGTGSSNEKNAYNAMVDISTDLTQKDVPDTGRFVIIPPWYYGLLLKDSRFVGYGTPFNVQNIEAGNRTGLVGRVAGLDVYVSNNVSSTNTTTCFKIIAGHPFAWSFAPQLTEVSAYKPEKRFGDAVKGLLLYGAAVVRTKGLCVHYASQGTL